MNAKLLGIKVVTSLHIGAGRGQGYVDLPIAREKTTNYPYAPGSALKGVFRDKSCLDGKDESLLSLAFGSRRVQTGERIAETTAGSLIFADARLLALPIRSFFGTFALVSCPTILRRLYADLRMFDAELKTPEIPDLTGAQIAVVSDSSLAYKEGKEKKVCLEDVDFQVVETSVDECGAFLAQKFPTFGEAREDAAKRARRFALVSDDAFSFLCQTGTEVSARIRINPETGIVQPGALWNQESLPSETFMYSFAFCDRIYGSANAQNTTPETLLNEFCPVNQDIYLQFGGKESTGLGRCYCRFVEAQ